MQNNKMKGLLSFLILWLVRKRSMTGVEIALELEKRKGRKPSPGTIYPVLKNLTAKDLLAVDEDKRYSLTRRGRNELGTRLKLFFKTFSDIDEMRSYRKE